MTARLPYTVAELAVARNSDWNDTFELRNEDDSAPLDLTGAVLELNIRPIHGYHDPLLFLTSYGGSGIIIDDDPTTGVFTIMVDRPTILEKLPAGKWQHHLTCKFPSDDADGWEIETVWRGYLFVLPGEISAANWEPTLLLADEGTPFAVDDEGGVIRAS